MKELIITDAWGYSSSFPISECAHIIPRVGEHVRCGKSSSGIVATVSYDYNEGVVFVKLAH